MSSSSAFSDSLRAKLAALQESPVRFDREHGTFVDRISGERRRPLTRLLARLVPVPNDTLDSAEIARAENRSVKARRSRHDPAPNAVMSMYAGSLVQQCGSCSDAHRYMATSAPSISARERLAAEIHPDIAHGLVVDAQLEMYLRCRSRRDFFLTCAKVDPCVGTLIEHFDSAGLCVVATQLALYSAPMGVATQFDIVLTDRATRSKLVLGEIKATRGAAATSGAAALERNNLQYERLRGRLTRTALRGMPLSYYSRHQIQLFCMLDMVRTTQGFTFDEAAVFRVSPGVVRTYGLNEYYLERASAIVRAISAKTGVNRKRKRGVSSKN